MLCTGCADEAYPLIIHTNIVFHNQETDLLWHDIGKFSMKLLWLDLCTCVCEGNIGYKSVEIKFCSFLMSKNDVPLLTSQYIYIPFAIITRHVSNDTTLTY